MKPLNRSRVGGLSCIVMLAFIALGTACGGKNVTPYTDPVCGNDRQEYGEECDGSDLDGQTCAGLGLESGDLACGADCRFNVTACTSEAVCDNGVIEYPEDCEGADLDGETCVSLGHDGGTLACNADCTFDVSGCVDYECGNGVIDPGETCDPPATCPDTCDDSNLCFIGVMTGSAASCDAACSYTSITDCINDDDCCPAGCDSTTDSDCSTSCGDGVIDPGETCDPPGTCPADCEDGDLCTLDIMTGSAANCNVDCGYAPIVACADGDGCCPPGCDTTTDDDCSSVCGNGMAEGGEQCDGADLAGATCENLGHDGGTLACAGGCTFDESGCIDCAPGLMLCAGGCVDILTDPAHCGGCTSPCGGNEVCVGGSCTPTAQPWTAVGDNPIDGLGSPGVWTHDLGTDGSWPTVVYVFNTAMPADRQAYVSTYTGAPVWAPLDPPPGSGYLEAVAIEFDGLTPYVLSVEHGVGNHVKYHQGGAWQEIGAPGGASACLSHWSAALALDGADPHVVSYGAGGCGLGVDHLWWDGASWQGHPGMMGIPGLIAMSGNGKPDVVFTSDAYIAIAEGGVHSVISWDPVGSAWANLGSALSMNAGSIGGEDMSITADNSGNLYVAWAERDDVGPGPFEIYVKTYLADWTLVGAGKVSGPGSAQSPSTTIIGSVPWVAYVERVGAVDQVFVRIWNGAAWQQVGPALNEDLAESAYEPVIVGLGGVPHVAFREESAGVQHLYIKKFP